MRRLLRSMNLKRFLDGLNTLRIQDGTKISPRSLVAVSRLTQPTPRATCCAHWEFQMNLLIVFSKRAEDLMHSMEPPTTRRWISKQRFLSLVLEPSEPVPRNHRRLMESKTWSCFKARIPYFVS